MKYVLIELVLNLLNFHWWILIALCMFISVKTAKVEEDEQIGKYLWAFIFGGMGIYFFERHIGSAKSFGIADILTIVLMIWLLGMIIKGRKSKSETSQNIVAPPLLGVSDGEPYILCRQCLIQKSPSSYESPSNDVCIECEQESVEKRAATAPSQAPSSIREQLRELKSFLDDGLINEADYDKKKSELLDKM